MKRIAFLQALIVFILLVGSWFLLFSRFRLPPEESEKKVPSPESQALKTPTGDVSESIPSTPVPTPNPTSLSPEWQKLLQPLDQARSPAEMRQLLANLQASILAMSPDQALAFINAYLDSWNDMKTGLALQPGPQGRLRGAASLRAVLLDWLHQLDPTLAGERARNELTQYGTALSPDGFVVHLRNLARDPSQPSDDINRQLAPNMNALLNHGPWINEPNAAIAEAMDILVFTADSRWTEPLAKLVDQSPSPLLRHAASLALERLVDANPLQTLGTMADLNLLQYLPKNRAGYFARLDPQLTGASDFLKSYLIDTASPPEQKFFLAALPNLNLSLSYNLLTSPVEGTQRINATERLNSAIALLHQWQTDPQFAHIESDLSNTIQRIQSQLGTPP